MNAFRHSRSRRAAEPWALRLSRTRRGRLVLHVWATVRRPRNAVWHGRCILREFFRPRTVPPP